jgi:pSer/pThr/pTyr-binding forkhead associated (FHA) protein
MIRPSRTTSPRAHDPRPALVPAGRFDAQPPFYLDRPVTLIGSRHRAHIRLESEDVSRSHAVVVNTRGRVIIRDLGSRTRVYVNGQEAWEAPLADGDYVTIGHFSFRFAAGDVGHYLGGAEEPPAAVLTAQVLPPGGSPLDTDLCVIGCRRGADLLLRGSAVSFAHAIIVRHESGHLIRDLGSRTGTFLNGVPIEGDAELRHGSVIRVGPYELRYAAAEQARRAAARGAAPAVLRVEPAHSAAEDEGLPSEALEDLPVLPPAAEAADVPATAVEHAPVAPVELQPAAVWAAAEQAPAYELEQVPMAGGAPVAAELPPVAPPAAPAELQPVADLPDEELPVAKAPRRRASRKKKVAKSKAKPRPAVEEAPPEDFAPLAPLMPPTMVTPLDAVTVVLPPAPPEPVALTNVTVFLPSLEPLAGPAAAVDAPVEQPPVSAEQMPEPAQQAPAPAVHDELPALDADLPPVPTPAVEPVIEEPAFEDLAPAETPVSEPDARAVDAFGFDVPALVAADDAAAAPEIPVAVALEPQPVPAAVAVQPVAPAVNPDAARPLDALRPPARPAAPRHGPAKPPPMNWGVLATAIAMSELPPDEAAPAAALPEAPPADGPARRSSRLKWVTAVAVLLVGGAAMVVAVFGHSALLKFLR